MIFWAKKKEMKEKKFNLSRYSISLFLSNMQIVLNCHFLNFFKLVQRGKQFRNAVQIKEHPKKIETLEFFLDSEVYCRQDLMASSWFFISERRVHIYTDLITFRFVMAPTTHNFKSTHQPRLYDFVGAKMSLIFSPKQTKTNQPPFSQVMKLNLLQALEVFLHNLYN